MTNAVPESASTTVDGHVALNLDLDLLREQGEAGVFHHGKVAHQLVGDALDLNEIGGRGGRHDLVEVALKLLDVGAEPALELGRVTIGDIA